MEDINISKYLQWLNEGRNFSEIRKDLHVRGFKHEEIDSIIRTIDEWYLQSRLQAQNQSKLKSFQLAGLTLIGVSVFILLYQLLILKGISFVLLYFIIGALSGGLSMMWYGRSNGGFGLIRQLRNKRFFNRGRG
jgi:hypothetical protein